MRKKDLSARILPVLLAALMLLGVFGVPAAAAQAAAPDSIQLTDTDGDAVVTGNGGRELTVRDGMRLYNGNRIQTAAASYAWIDMGSGWHAKMDASSAVQLHSSGTVPELLLEAGGLFFNDTGNAQSEQTLSIRTPVMSAAVQGACGWVEAVNRWTARLYVLSGTVQCTVADPVTGESQTASVGSGKTVTLTVYPQDQEGPKCSVRDASFTPAVVSGYVLQELAQDVTLCGSIYDDIGMDVLAPLGLLGSVARQLDEIKMVPAQMRGLIDEKGDEQQIRDSLSTFDQALTSAAALLDGASLSQQGKQDLQQARDLQQQGQQALESGQLLDAANLLEDAWGCLVSAGAPDEAMSMAAIQAEELLIEEQLDVRQRQDVIDQQLAAQEEASSKSELWVAPTPSPSPSPSPSPAPGGGGGGGGGGAGTDSTPAPVTPSPEPTPVELVMGTFTLEELQQAIYSSAAGVIVIASADPAQNTLTIPDGQSLFIGSGKTLTLQADTTTDPEAPRYINIVIQRSTDPEKHTTLTVMGTLTADKQCVITNYDTIRTSGKVDPKIVMEDGTLSAIDGTISNGIVVHGGTVSVSKGTVRYGIVQERRTGDAIPSSVTVSGTGKVVGGYYLSFLYDEELGKQLLEADPNHKDADFSFSLSTGGSIEYLASEAPVAGGALVIDTDAQHSTGYVRILANSTIDGKEAPAILVGDMKPSELTIFNDAIVRSSTELPVVFAGNTAGSISFNGKAITPASFLVTTENKQSEEEDAPVYYVLKDVYASFEAALAAGGTVKLNRDVETAVEALAADVTIDLNGHTLKLTNTVALTGSLTVTGSGTLISDAEGSVVLVKDLAKTVTVGSGVTAKFKASAFTKVDGDETGTGYVPNGGWTVSETPDENGYLSLVQGEGGLTPPTPSPVPTEDPEATDAPATDAPATDTPATDTPTTDTPTTDTPTTDTPATDTPTTDTPATDTPATDTPTTDTPATDTPTTDTPATDTPTTDTPTTDTPTTDTPTTDTPAANSETSSDPSQTDPQPVSNINSEEVTIG